MLEVDRNAREPRPSVLTSDNQLRRIGVHDLDGPVSPVTRIRIPKSFNAKVPPKSRRDLASSMRHAISEDAPHSRRNSRHEDFGLGGAPAGSGEEDRGPSAGPAGSSVPWLQRTRRPCTVVGALVEVAEGDRWVGQADPRQDEYHRQDFRPRLRCPVRLWLPGKQRRRTRHHQPRRAAASADLR